MAEKSEKDKRDREKALLRLVRLVDEGTPDSNEGLSEESIAAYLAGEANKEQELEVIGAMNRSILFRRDMLELAEEYEAFKADSTAEPESSKSNRSEKESLWEKTKDFFAIKVLIPAAVTAAAVILVSVQLMQPGPQWELISGNVDPGKLISMQLKGPTDERAQTVFSSAEEAALASFRDMLVLEDTEINIRSDYAHPSVRQAGQHLRLELFDERGAPLAGFEMDVSYADGSSPESFQVWFLSLPSRQLSRMEVDGDPIVIKWSEGIGASGCLTLTYRSSGGFHNSPGFVLQVPD